MEKTLKRLKKDLARNPAKSGALGVCLLVAVYFWMPLLGKWFGGTKPAEPTADAAALVVTPNTSPANDLVVDSSSAPAVAKSAKESLSWKQMAELLTQQRKTQVATLASVRDPFASLKKLVEPTVDPEAPPVAAKHAPPPPAVTPQACGLVLGSTIVGRDRSTAMINDLAYAVGESIAAKPERQASSGNPEHENSNSKPSDSTVYFVLLEIQPHQVVLERNGEKYTLERAQGGGTSQRLVVRGGEVLSQ